MYTYNNTFCHSDKVGRYGIFEDSLKAMQPKIKQVFEFLKSTNSQTPYYKVIHKQNLEKSIAACSQIVKTIDENFDSYVYVGMGGAILNPMMMSSLPNKLKSKKVYFINTTDPVYFLEIMEGINLAKTAFIVISNSGETSETISMMGAFINEFEKAGLDFKRHFFLCTSPDDTTIRVIGKKFNLPIIDYDPDVGGRFSSFSSSAVLPAMLMGLDLEAMTRGANKVVEDFWNNKENSKPVKAALDILLAKQNNILLMSYSSHLNAFLEWYCQIISESLGKEGVGYTPIRGLGPQEQHSIMQLCLEGPKDKLYTLIYAGDAESIKQVVVANDFIKGHFLEGKSLSAINTAFFEATAKCLVDKQLPLRTIMLERLDEESFGQLLMHSTIEMVFLALLMGLNPFDQPGVDAIKIEAKKILTA